MISNVYEEWKIKESIHHRKYEGQEEQVRPLVNNCAMQIGSK